MKRPIRPPAIDRLGRPRGGRWRGRLPERPHAHPLVRQIIAEMNRRELLFCDVAAMSGVPHATIKNWCARRAPNVVTLDAVAGALGLRLALVDTEDAA